MGTRGTFVIPIRDIDAAGRQCELTVSAAWLRGALEGCEIQPAGPDAQLSVLVSKSGRNVLVRGTLSVDLVVPCARCLEPVHVRSRAELSLLLSPATPAARPPEAVRAGARRPPVGEFTTGEADVDTYEGDEIVLDGFVREAVLLEAPIFPLCSETCEGIRPIVDPAPGTPSEVPSVSDPRLLPLLELGKRRPTKE